MISRISIGSVPLKRVVFGICINFIGQLFDMLIKLAFVRLLLCNLMD